MDSILSPELMDSIGSRRKRWRKQRVIVRLISSRVTSSRHSNAAKALAALVETISPLNPSTSNSLQT